MFLLHKLVRLNYCPALQRLDVLHNLGRFTLMGLKGLPHLTRLQLRWPREHDAAVALVALTRLQHLELVAFEAKGHLSPDKLAPCLAQLT